MHVFVHNHNVMKKMKNYDLLNMNDVAGGHFYDEISKKSNGDRAHRLVN